MKGRVPGPVRRMRSTLRAASGVVVILVLLGMFFGTYQFLEKHYAIAEDNSRDHLSISKGLANIERRLDQKIMGDRRDIIQNQIWRLEEKNIKKKSINEWSVEDRDKYKRLQVELSDLDKKLEKVQ